MLLKQLSLLNFRNIEECCIQFSPKLNCFVGNNGMGKTNFLDAIYYLSFCRSAFTSMDAYVLRHDTPFLSLEGTYSSDDGTQEVIQCGMKRGSRKVFRRNGKAYKRLSEHIGLIPVVMIAPADIALIEGGSDGRRHLMDMVISQYHRPYLESITRYAQALAQRNAMLKGDDAPDPLLLDVLEQQMATAGDVIYEQRKTFVDELLPLFNRVHGMITQQSDDVQLTYRSQRERGEWQEQLLKGREKDHIIGYTRVGVHRDDIEITLNQWPMKTEGSQGQHKSLAIALKLAVCQLLQHKNNGTPPILLLDDIFDKLDAQRVENIVHIVAESDFGQIFMTDTNRAHIDHILQEEHSDYSLFLVEEGRIRMEKLSEDDKRGAL